MLVEMAYNNSSEQYSKHEEATFVSLFALGNLVLMGVKLAGVPD